MQKMVLKALIKEDYPIYQEGMLTTMRSKFQPLQTKKYDIPLTFSSSKHKTFRWK
jgi:hypothetical protein